MIKALEEQNQLTTTMLHSLTNLQRQIHSGHPVTNTEGGRRNSCKKNVKLGQRKKGSKPFHSRDQQRQPSQAVIKPTRMMGDKPRKPLKCWGCGGDHLIKYCPHRNGNDSQVHNTQGADTVGHEAGTIPRICASLKDRQEGHQSTVVELEGKIAK